MEMGRGRESSTWTPESAHTGPVVSPENVLGLYNVGSSRPLYRLAYQLLWSGPTLS